MPSDHAKKRAAKKKEMAKGKRKGAKAAEEDPEIQVRAIRFTSYPLSSPVYLFFLNITCYSHQGPAVSKVFVENERWNQWPRYYKL